MQPRTPTHPAPDVLAAFGLGKLNDSAALTVANHLETCASCRQAVEKAGPDSFIGRVRAVNPPGSRTQLPAGLAPGSPGRPESLPPPPLPTPKACPPSDLPPALLQHPKFQILNELGRGGMGTVYHAKHKVMDRDVALKVINKALLEHPDALPRFFAEVKAAAKLDHPNIVRAYDAEPAGDLQLFVMEYVEGKSLAQVLDIKGTLPVAHACHYIRQAALGLQHAFEQGMVHRDIKPANLMLTPKGKVKVLDFGLARLASEQTRGTGLTQANAFMGTPEFVAPEQAMDARQADIRADLYSLGCTLYCLLAGQPPFLGETVMKIVMAHLEKEAPPVHKLRPDAQPELSAVVARLLAKDPAKRYQKPIEVAQALGTFCKVGPQAAPGQIPPVPAAARKAAKAGTMIANDAAGLSYLRCVMPKVAPQEAVVFPSEKPVSASPFETLEAANPGSGKSKGRPDAGPRRRTPNRRWLFLGGIAAVVVLLAAIVLRMTTKDGVLVVVVNEPNAKIFVNGATATVTWGDGGKKAEIRIKPGTYTVEVEKEGFKAYGEKVTLQDGGREIIEAKLDKVPPIELAKIDPPKDPIKKPEQPQPEKGAKIDPNKREAIVEQKDFLQKGSTWKGIGNYTFWAMPGPQPRNFEITLTITQRETNTFKGIYELEDGSLLASKVEGEVERIPDSSKLRVHWNHIADIKGNSVERAPCEMKGTMDGPVLAVSFVHWNRDLQRGTGHGTIEFKLEKDK